MFGRGLIFKNKSRLVLDEIVNNRYINLLNEETRKFTISYSYLIRAKKSSEIPMNMEISGEELLLDLMDEDIYSVSELDAQIKLLDEFGSHEDNQ